MLQLRAVHLSLDGLEAMYPAAVQSNGLISAKVLKGLSLGNCGWDCGGCS